MPFKVGDAIIEVKPQLITGFETALAGALSKPLVAAAGGFGDSLQELGNKLTTRVTLPLGIGAAAAQVQFAALDSSLREAVTLFGHTGDAAQETWDVIRSGVNEASDDLGVFERDVTAAVSQALSTEVPEDTVFQFVETATKAAVGGSVELETAVGGIATAVNTFTEQMLTAEQASDIMFRGVVRGATTFEELSVYMNQVAPLAAAAAVSFEELIAATATMTILGTPTRSAFTNIKSALTGLLRPTAELTDIWNSLGFATADQAIAQEGLAFAMDAVYDATNGQVGALIKLLGGAEAANAVLQVTGSNADLFTSVLRDMESATGATASAFEVMDASSSRTFEKLAVQLDQVGNFIGDIGFAFVSPLAKATTAVVGFGTSALEQLSKLPDPIKVVASGIVGLAATFGPLLSIVGALLSSQTGSLLALSGVFKLLGTGGLIKTVIGSIAGTTAALTGMTKLLDPLTNKLINLKRWGLQPLVTVFGQWAVTAGGIGVALVAATVAFKAYEGWLERLELSQKATTDGARILAESLELVAKPVEEMQALDADIDINFRAENSQLIQQIQDARDSGLLESRLVEVAFQLHMLGNTPDDIMNALRTLTEAAGTDIPVTFNLEAALDPEVFGQSVERAFNTINPRLEAAFGELTGFLGTDIFRSLDPEARQFTAQLENMAEQVASLFRAGTVESINEAFRLIEYINQSLGDGGDSADYFGDSLLKALDVRGQLGFTVSGIQDLDALLTQLQDKLGLEPQLVMDPFEDNLSRGTGSVYAFIDSLESVPPATAEAAAATAAAAEEAQTKASEGANRLRGVIQQVNADIRSVFTTTRDEIRAQIPLFGEYEGAVDLDLEQIIESLQQFGEDTQSWVDLSTSLYGQIPEALREELNNLPLEQRAALAKLEEEAPGEFATWLAEVKTQWDAARDSAAELWEVQVPKLQKEGQARVLAEAQAISADMGAAGDAAAAAWQQEFSRIAAGWWISAQTYAQRVVDVTYRTLKVTSPSRVFMDIGAQTAQGFIDGLESKRDATMRAVQGLYGAAAEQQPEEFGFGFAGDRIGAPAVDSAAYERMGREVARALGRGLRDEAELLGGGVLVGRRTRVGPDPADLRTTRLLENTGRLPL